MGIRPQQRPPRTKTPSQHLTGSRTRCIPALSECGCSTASCRCDSTRQAAWDHVAHTTCARQPATTPPSGAPALPPALVACCGQCNPAHLLKCPDEVGVGHRVRLAAMVSHAVKHGAGLDMLPAMGAGGNHRVEDCHIWLAALHSTRSEHQHVMRIAALYFALLLTNVRRPPEKRRAATCSW